MRNGSGYGDSTAGAAIANVSDEMRRYSHDDPDDRNNKLVKAVKMMVDLAGFDLIERIVVKDRRTGKVYR